MGNRVNYGFKSTDVFAGNTLYLYQHWGPHDTIAHELAEALQFARPRWDDPAYATRRMIGFILGNEILAETGSGLTINALSDNEHIVYTVDWDNQQVFTDMVEENPVKRWSFNEFVDNSKQIDEWYLGLDA